MPNLHVVCLGLAAVICLHAGASDAAQSVAVRPGPDFLLASLGLAGEERTRAPASSPTTGRSPVLAQAPVCVSAINSCKQFSPDIRCNRDDLKRYTRSGAKWCRTAITCAC